MRNILSQLHKVETTFNLSYYDESDTFFLSGSYSESKFQIKSLCIAINNPNILSLRMSRECILYNRFREIYSYEKAFAIQDWSNKKYVQKIWNYYKKGIK